MRPDMGPGVGRGTWEEGGRREVWDEGRGTGEREDGSGNMEEGQMVEM